MGSLRYLKFQYPLITQVNIDPLSYFNLILCDLRALLCMDLADFNTEFTLPELARLINSYLLNSPRYYELDELPQNLRKVNEDIYKSIYLVILRLCTTECNREHVLTSDNFFNFCGLYGFEDLVTESIVSAYKESIDFDIQLPLFYCQTNAVLQDISDLGRCAHMVCDAVNILYQTSRILGFGRLPVELMMSLADIYENYAIPLLKQRCDDLLLLFVRKTIYDILQKCLVGSPLDKMSLVTYKRLFKDLSLREIEDEPMEANGVAETEEPCVEDTPLANESDVDPVEDTPLANESDVDPVDYNPYNDDFEESDDFVG